MTGDRMEELSRPRWRDLGDSRDLAAAVRTAYHSTPATASSVTTVDGVCGVAPANAAETDALTLLRTSGRRTRLRSGAPRRAAGMIGVVALLGIALVAPKAVVTRLRASADVPAVTSVPQRAAERPAVTTTPAPLDPEPWSAETPPAAPAPEAPAAAAPSETTVAPAPTTPAPRRTATTRARAASSPTTTAPAPRQSPEPTQAPPPDEPQSGDGW